MSQLGCAVFLMMRRTRWFFIIERTALTCAAYREATRFSRENKPPLLEQSNSIIAITVMQKMHLQRDDLRGVQ
jgi:hypothetical protein